MCLTKCSPSRGAVQHVLFYMWLQYHLDAQLRTASAACAALRVALKGDVPIGVDPQSADTWYFRQYFNMDTQSGAPPDAFCEHGQNWTFPTYVCSRGLGAAAVAAVPDECVRECSCVDDLTDVLCCPPGPTELGRNQSGRL